MTSPPSPAGPGLGPGSGSDSGPNNKTRDPRPIFDHDDGHIPSDEVSPLLGATVPRRYDGAEPNSLGRAADNDAARAAKASQSSLPSVVAIILLGLASILALAGLFILPHNVEAYVKEAAVLEPTNLAIESVTADGIRARVQATFHLDSRRVTEDTPRKVGTFATWAVRTLGTTETRLDLYHDQGGRSDQADMLLGSLNVPPLTINLVDAQSTHLDFVTDIVPGDAEVFRSLANQWLHGQLGAIKILGKANVTVKTGAIPLGTHAVAESVMIEAGDVPAIPKYTISRLNFRDVGKSAVGADVAVTAFNRHPLKVAIPPLAFDVLIPDCNPLDPYLLVSRATTDAVQVSPESNVTASAHAIVHQIPKAIMRVCPKSTSSPLDEFLHRYLNGKDATVFVRGSHSPIKGTPTWISTILSGLVVPIPFPGNSYDDIIKEFSLTDIDFSLPDPFAEPGTPDANPKVSGDIHVVAALPNQLNVDIGVSNVRASANISYQSRKFGELHLKKWHAANSTRVTNDVTGEPALKIDSHVKNAPLTITDSDVFSEVVQELLFGDKDILLDADATVDVQVTTSLGKVIIRDVPASGQIPVKHLPGGSITKGLEPQISELRIIDSSSTSMTLSALVNVTNPTPYSASIPYINVNVLSNGSVLGNVTLRNVNVTKGRNLNIPVSTVWAPENSGSDARKAGIDLISGYLSSLNTTVTAKLHAGSIPACPMIGRALSNIAINATVPRLSTPHNGDRPGGDNGDEDDKNNFIRDATFHILSSTATFTLASPLQYDTITLRSVNATAFWNHTEPVGEIIYDYPFDAPPGFSTTPRLPVDWSAGSIGYSKLLGAIGGKLKLDARANVTVAIRTYEETLWYIGKGIGATVRL